MSAPVNVLAVMDYHRALVQVRQEHGGCGVSNVVDADEARAAVAELIAADKALDFWTMRRIEADNRITLGDRSDDAFSKQASAWHAYDRAVAHRRAALARVQGGAA